MSALPVVAPLPLRVPAPARPAADDRLFAELHARHEAELLRFCRWMLKNGEDAADAAQDTWIRAMTALAEGNVRVAAHRPWLFAIARNVCLDRLRERKRASLHELDEACAGETPGADDVVAIRHEADAALALVGSLSERQRSALLMRELAGMSVPDIAAALGLSVDKAHWTIADARRALDEARAGTTLACEEVRTRMGAGHRSRGVRSHLAACAECRAHDRRARARRILLLLPAWLLPRAAAVPALMAAVALPVVSAEISTRGEGSEPPAAKVTKPTPALPTTPLGGKTRLTAEKSRPRPAERRAAKPKSAAKPRAAAPATPSPRSSEPAMQPVAAPRPEPARSEAVTRPVKAVVERVASTVETVTAPLPVVDDAAATATTALRQLASGL